MDVCLSIFLNLVSSGALPAKSLHASVTQGTF
jgi:hypothetical protein